MRKCNEETCVSLNWLSVSTDFNMDCIKVKHANLSRHLYQSSMYCFFIMPSVDFESSINRLNRQSASTDFIMDRIEVKHIR